MTAYPLLDFSPLQKNPAAPLGGEIRRWQLESGNIIWSPDATHIANYAIYVCHEAIPTDGLMKKQTLHKREGHIWEIATQSEITPRSGLSALAWSPNSDCVAIPWTKQRIDLIEDGSGRRKMHTTQMVEIWGISNKRELLEAYEGHTESIVALAWSPGNKYIASVSRDGNIHVWDAHSAKCMLILETHLYEMNPYYKITTTIEWSPDGTQLAFIIPYELVQVWQVV